MKRIAIISVLMALCGTLGMVAGYTQEGVVVIPVSIAIFAASLVSALILSETEKP